MKGLGVEHARGQALPFGLALGRRKRERRHRAAVSCANRVRGRARPFGAALRRLDGRERRDGRKQARRPPAVSPPRWLGGEENRARGQARSFGAALRAAEETLRRISSAVSATAVASAARPINAAPFRLLPRVRRAARRPTASRRRLFSGGHAGSAAKHAWYGSAGELQSRGSGFIGSFE